MAQYASAPDNNLPPPPKIPQDTLDALFPSAVDKPRESIPFPYPRASAESAQTLVKLLKQNHEQFHIFFNDKGFHKCVTIVIIPYATDLASLSVILAIICLPSTPSEPALRSSRPHTKSMPHISGRRSTPQNRLRTRIGGTISEIGCEFAGFRIYLTVHTTVHCRYYRGYLAFFSNHILKDGIASALEKFIFSTEANYVKGKADEDQPKFLDRFLSGLLHPMIHVGHGVEFNASGMLAEGKPILIS